MNIIKTSVFSLITFCTLSVQAQNFDKQGMASMMKGDFKTAISHLQRAEQADPNNVNVTKMLAYSYFQNNNFEKAIESYSKVISLKPDDMSAYYYRGKARLNVANNPKESTNDMRDAFYQAAIKDFSKGLELTSDEDIQLLQNRGIAYKDYAIYKSYKAKKAAEKNACISMFNSSIGDFQKLLTLQPQRKDISSLIDYVKAQITSMR